MLPEEMDAFADGMEAGHVAGKAAIKARRADLPVGLSLAIVDDVVDGDDASVRDRKRAEVYERWLELARDDDFVGVQNYERIPYDGHGAVAPPAGTPLNQMGSAIEPLSLGGSVRYAHEATGVPVLVTEHGMSTDDDTLRAAFIEPSLAGLLDVMERRGAGARLPALDADGQLRVGLRLRPPARAARGRPRDLRRVRRSRAPACTPRSSGSNGPATS